MKTQGTNIKTKKEAVVVILCTPISLYQFAWFYSTYGKEYEWTALCMPGKKGEMYMADYCQKSGIFKKIIRAEQGFYFRGSSEKVIILLQMMCYRLIGKRNILCKKLIGQYLDVTPYDMAVVSNDLTIVTGSFIAIGSEKNVMILEEGTNDYQERKKTPQFRAGYWANECIGFLLSKLGYANPAVHYELETTKYCTKFASMPEKMVYTNYKQICQMFDMESTDTALFEQICKRLYEVNRKEILNGYDVLLFTVPFDDFTEDSEKYHQKLEAYINKNYSGKNIIIKKHPRDTYNYRLDQCGKIAEIDRTIPGELIFPLEQKVKVLLAFPSSLMFILNATKYPYDIAYMKELAEEPVKTLRSYKNEFTKNVHRFKGQLGKVLEL